MEKYTELKHRERIYWENKAIEFLRNKTDSKYFNSSFGYSYVDIFGDVPDLAEFLYYTYCEGLNDTHEQRNEMAKDTYTEK